MDCPTCRLETGGNVVHLPPRPPPPQDPPTEPAREAPVASLLEYRARSAAGAAPGDPDLSSLTWMDELLADFPRVLSERETHDGAVLLAPHHAVRAEAVRPYLREVLKAAIRALCRACTEGPHRDPSAGWCPLHAPTEVFDLRVAAARDGALGQRNAGVLP